MLIKSVTIICIVLLWVFLSLSLLFLKWFFIGRLCIGLGIPSYWFLSRCPICMWSFTPETDNGNGLIGCMPYRYWSFWSITGMCCHCLMPKSCRFYSKRSMIWMFWGGSVRANTSDRAFIRVSARLYSAYIGWHRSIFW